MVNFGLPSRLASGI
jgi:hypothetical protein